jgi:hypothetical protein
MRVSDQILECVAFIGIPIALPNGEQAIRFGGTAFFVEEDAHDDPPKVWSYLVTARHVAEQVAHSTFYVRLNTKDGQSIPVQGSGVRWWIHPTDPTADVAVIRWFPPADIVQYKRINTKDLVTNQTIADGKVGPGDDAMMIGLFSGHPGVQQNVPVVRLGSVAMIPREPVATEEGLMDAYLVEGRSIGGLSGSPVWVTETMAHSIYDAKGQGHWN